MSVPVKRAGLLGLALVVASAGAWGQSRQTAQQHPAHQRGQHGEHAAHHQQATGVKLDVKDNAAAQVMTLRVGPLNLPAHSGHMAVAQAPDLYLTIPFDGWIVAYHPRLTDANGEMIPPKMLHHVAFWNTARSDFLCPNKEEHIFGAGGEMNDWPVLPGFGYRVQPGERIRINTMFHNPTGTDYPQAYIEVRMEYRRAETGEVWRSVYPAWFDVERCGSSSYDLAAGINVTAGEFTVGYAGMLLGVGGHLHDYGERLVLENITRKEQIATLNSELDPAGQILSMPIATFTNSGGYRMNPGEKIRVTATYNNRTGQALPDGAMGIVVGYFLPDDDAAMAALKRDPKKVATRE